MGREEGKGRKGEERSGKDCTAIVIFKSPQKPSEKNHPHPQTRKLRHMG